MNTQKKTALFAALMTASLSALAAQPLLPAGSDDQVPVTLSSLPAPTGDFERAPVSFSWPLDPAAELAAPAPHRAESREFWMTVEGRELERGVDLELSAPGALIRVSPARGSAPLPPGQLKVSQSGRAVALESMASDRQLQAAGMAVNDGTAVMRLNRGAGAGRYQLQGANAHGRYVVHVFEPDSDVVLKAQPRRNHALAGERMTVDIEMTHGRRGAPARAEALLVAPDGESFPVKVRMGRSGHGAALARLPKHVPQVPGLWELQVFANDGRIARDARTAFAVAQPTARFDGRFEADADRLQIDLPVEIASGGRYEVRGTLYATGPDKRLRPVSQAHSAQWLESGGHALQLRFDPARLPAGYGAPYEVRQLELHDKARQAPLEIRKQGMRF